MSRFKTTLIAAGLIATILLLMSGPRFASGAMIVASVYGEELRGVPTASGELTEGL